ncbi:MULTISPECIES: hypothetical protein [Chitinophagaceae]
MRRNKQILLVLALLVSFGIQKTFAAFIIDDDGSKKENNKYTLKQLHRQNEPFSLSSLSKKKWALDENLPNAYSLPPVNAVPVNSVEIQSPVLLQKGHTMYIYNYKYKVQPSNPLPMFRAPSRADYGLK